MHTKTTPFFHTHTHTNTHTDRTHKQPPKSAQSKKKKNPQNRKEQKKPNDIQASAFCCQGLAPGHRKEVVVVGGQGGERGMERGAGGRRRKRGAG